MKIRFFENSGDMLLMALYSEGKLVYAHDYSGDYDRARVDAEAAIDADADQIADWDGNILDDGVVLEDQYGIADDSNAAASLAKWIEDNDTGDTNTGISEIDVSY